MSIVFDRLVLLDIYHANGLSMVWADSCSVQIHSCSDYLQD